VNFKNLIFILVFILLSRFIGRIFVYGIRFWYISVPLVIYLYFTFRDKAKKKQFKKRTHLDPDKEVKLKKDVEINDGE